MRDQAAATGRRVVIATFVVATIQEADEIADEFAGDLREAGWEPASISVLDPAESIPHA